MLSYGFESSLDFVYDGADLIFFDEVWILERRAGCHYQIPECLKLFARDRCSARLR